MVLLGLMVLALIIAAATHDDSTADSTPASQSPTTATTTTAPGTGAAGQAVIDQINAQITGLPFVVGKAELAPGSATQLDKIAATLAATPTLNAEVRGFTDNQGDPAKNVQLSLARAQAVVTYLTGKGIAASRLEAKGLGALNPIGDNATEAGRAKNRRVEFALA
jgi:outer membrane protein OmpA-like peptidoglycan-associated protein